MRYGKRTNRRTLPTRRFRLEYQSQVDEHGGFALYTRWDRCSMSASGQRYISRENSGCRILSPTIYLTRAKVVFPHENCSRSCDQVAPLEERYGCLPRRLYPALSVPVSLRLRQQFSESFCVRAPLQYRQGRRSSADQPSCHDLRNRHDSGTNRPGHFLYQPDLSDDPDRAGLRDQQIQSGHSGFWQL